MSSPSSPARGRPARIDRERTVRTALDLLDRSGLDALTMRRLADAMDVQAGALYRYFATKQDLLAAMAERMMDGVVDAAAGTCGGDWSERLTALARAMRAALLSRRDGARVFAGTHSTGANMLGFADTVVGVMRAAGFPDDDAARALYTLANFTVGHTLEEQAALQGENDGPADPGLLADAVAGGTYAHLAAGLPALTSTDFTRLFEFGLNLIVEGLRARR
ncbi:TetR/AcrR family transcriptional regulator [Streptantibioticus cattleyicolor]|uniref:Transcriptional regulator n=1 Tax=Streptantibioticus cattleyicolor (strain ATCC 35852 / DSM 46488 / JCM 4925 / NBRC 14057 / NRRL 8057) TaxID=1003195 RepID=F8JJJ7_STREN|nr:TetR/AcrR family transcriptional regulator [Streptantibioticus cattleyicolor]AEW98668.1 transcriptional regulator [Streptantibioticus cattleyicolor NRRL 8057 = DSM 46488]CCB72274.1 putative transcriptional regulator [Streptantibioticus cattleyicolor NRRL 8057 = DSM 46488]